MKSATDLVTFTEEILNGKLHFLWSVSKKGKVETLDTLLIDILLLNKYETK